MKAVVQRRYGPPDVLRLEEVERPAPGDGEVLVRVRAASVHPGDLMLMRGLPYAIRPAFGLRGPRKQIPGFDVAGTVEETGPGVEGLRPGDPVFGAAEGSCAEYVAASEDDLVAKPDGLPFRQAAGVAISGVTALQALRDQGEVRSGEEVLVVGASGGVGTFAVQLATWMGARVTGVCSTRNVELVRSLGADRVIDYTREDFAERGDRYDFILDNVASHSLSRLRRLLAPGGTLVPNSSRAGGRWIGPLGRMLAAFVLSPFVRGRLRPFMAVTKKEDLLTLRELLASGELTPVVDGTYPLEETAAALRHLGEGHARGKVIVAV